MSLACLPWYDLRETQKATDRLYARIARALREQGVADVPDRLDRRADYESQWSCPTLILGQACGYDVYCANHHALEVVGVPLYDFPGCEGNKYRSFVIVREDAIYRSLKDLRGARCVINSPLSHSGMNVLQALISPLSSEGSFFGDVQISGAHERSLEMIMTKSADVAAIDCITYGLLKRHRPQAIASTRIVHRTCARTAPPYVTRRGADQTTLALLRNAIALGIDSLDEQDRHDLGLLGVAPAQLKDYESIGAQRDEAEKARYTELSRACSGR